MARSNERWHAQKEDGTLKRKMAPSKERWHSPKKDVPLKE
jgi:hypothetical protein